MDLSHLTKPAIDLFIANLSVIRCHVVRKSAISVVMLSIMARTAYIANPATVLVIRSVIPHARLELQRVAFLVSVDISTHCLITFLLL